MFNYLGLEHISSEKVKKCTSYEFKIYLANE